MSPINTNDNELAWGLDVVFILHTHVAGWGEKVN